MNPKNRIDVGKSIISANNPTGKEKQCLRKFLEFNAYL
jgi:hypothetical protein